MNTVGIVAPVARSSAGFAPAAPSVGPLNIYYGWYNVVIALAVITLAVGSTSYSFGLYVKPAAAELGLTRAATNLGLVLFMMGGALSNPFLGILYDRFPIKTLLRIFAVLFFVGMAGVSIARSPLLIVFFMIGPLAVGASGSTIFGVVLASRWFTHLRSRAILIVTLGTSLGGLLVYPLMAYLMERLGWRASLAVMAALATGTTLVMSFFIRARPDPITAEQLVRLLPARELSVSAKDILGMSDFWFIAVPVSLLLAVDGTTLVTLTPYMLDRGMTLAMTATVMSSMTVSAICAKFFIAWIADRVDLRILLAGTAVAVMILCTILLMQPSYMGLLIVGLLTGGAMGGTYPLGAALLAKRFGAPSVGTATGLQMPLMSILSMAALYFTGTVHDRTGSYSIALVTLGIVCLVSMCMIPFMSKAPSAAAAKI
jgi:MFS family permease